MWSRSRMQPAHSRLVGAASQAERVTHRPRPKSLYPRASPPVWLTLVVRIRGHAKAVDKSDVSLSKGHIPHHKLSGKLSFGQSARIPAVTSLPMTATTRGRRRRASVTKISSTRSATRRCRRRGSRIFGGIESGENAAFKVSRFAADGRTRSVLRDKGSFQAIPIDPRA